MKHRKKSRNEAWTAAAVGALLLFALSCEVRADDRAAPLQTQVVAHRGSSVDRPENTLASIQRAIEAGATTVEVDVRLTKDGVAVLSHDAKLDRTTNGRGKVADKTLAEIQRLDAGSWFDARFAGERVPTLTQVMALCKGKIGVLLDLKESGDNYYSTIVEAVKTQGAPDRVTLGVRNLGQARRLRELLPTVHQLGLIEEPDEIEAYAAAGVEAVRLWPKWLHDTKVVDRVRRAGMKLHVNLDSTSPGEVAEVLEHRPDSLLTDDPARLVTTLTPLAK